MARNRNSCGSWLTVEGVDAADNDSGQEILDKKAEMQRVFGSARQIRKEIGFGRMLATPPDARAQPAGL